jgi:hypothetical protein
MKNVSNRDGWFQYPGKILGQEDDRCEAGPDSADGLRFSWRQDKLDGNADVVFKSEHQRR